MKLYEAHVAQVAKQPKTSEPTFVLFYSDTFCPILRYHSQLITELLSVLPQLLQRDSTEEVTEAGTSEYSSSEAHCLTVVLSLKSDLFIRHALATPFHIDLFDRTRLAEVQIANSFTHLQTPILLDDSFALQQDRSKNEHCEKGWLGNSLRTEAIRLQKILAKVNGACKTSHTIELVTVLEQSQTNLYGIPPEMPGKVVYVVTKRQSDKSRLGPASSVQWVDRLFMQAGYSLSWVRDNLYVINAMIDTEGANEEDEEHGISDWSDSSESSEDEDDGTKTKASSTSSDTRCSRTGAARDEEAAAPSSLCSSGKERKIYLSDMRPEEAKVRVMVRQGRGGSALEQSVLDVLERTKLFEMQASRLPQFSHVLSNLSLRHKPAPSLSSLSSTADSRVSDASEANPFL